jgi:predicted tellurium resistance membrane protein TerC
MKTKQILKILSGMVLTGFGGMSLFMTLSVIFDWFGIREKEGNYVLFIVYANLICGVLYIGTAYSLFKNPKITRILMPTAVVILIAAFIGLQMHIQAGGIYEEKTVKAMIFRIIFTIVLGAASIFLSKKSNNKKLASQ